MLTSTNNSKENSTIGSVILIVLGSIWIIGLCAADLFFNWKLEQSLFAVSYGFPDDRWLNHAIYSGLILVTCVIVVLAVKQPRIRRIFRLWTVGAVLLTLFVPIRTFYLTAQNGLAVFQIVSMLLLVIGDTLYQKTRLRTNFPTTHNGGRLTGAIVFLGALISIPWVLWGALGSVLDTILEILVGITFAWMAVHFIFSTYLCKNQSPTGEINKSKLLLDGLVVSVFLLMVVTALSQNGSQQMLVTTIPITGWLVVFMAAISNEQGGHGKTPSAIILAVVMALPLTYFDMDELAVIFTGSKGETLEWANKAALITFFGIVVISVAVFTGIRKISQRHFPKTVSIGLMICGPVGILLIYLIWGQVGFFGDHQLVILKEQADLSTLMSVQDVSVRRQTVFDTLVQTAESSQLEIRTRLDKMHLDYTPYYLLNAIEVKGDSLTRILLLNDPAVDRILESPQLRPLPVEPKLDRGSIDRLYEVTQWNISMIHADQVKNEMGVTGSGIIIGQTDSGVDGLHPELAASYRGVNSGDDYNWYDPWNGTRFPTDKLGHGTLTLAVAMGEHTGVAPEAQWIGCVNLARNMGNPAHYLDCMQFMLAPFPQRGDAFVDGDPSSGAMIVNNSWGCPEAEGCDAEVFDPVMKALKIAGIFMSVAAGNSGTYGCSTVSDPPAIYAEAFSVGSVNRGGDVSYFSSLGPVLVDGSGRLKPDLLAPGEVILSAFPGGSYARVSGTSFAAPHVSGVVALMWSANPELIGEIDATFDILKRTANAYSGADSVCDAQGNGTGTGILDAYEAVQAAIAFIDDMQ